jgi:hypothetical protein
MRRARIRDMAKKPKPTPKVLAKSTENASGQSEPECLELLHEFVKAFESIPQRYCLFCEANAALGIEAHKPDCPFRRASQLIKQKTPSTGKPRN